MTSTAVQSLTVADIERAVVAALDGSPDPAKIADFLADVDWSGYAAVGEGDPVAETLGNLEQWTTELQESAISRMQWTTLLASLLPADDDAAKRNFRAS